ncbi:hypothetical protein HOLleu_21987 [Holothuria leucospilota]|uniref:CCHC-type domain-containing protein n=1 Tax=Holothuria leucospilota TaxID=206669 RepID=A0A9Q1H6V2_HOLLE|nr:hypothetical protein HOLleu_21987 [Holothuria leucospilota]
MTTFKGGHSIFGCDEFKGLNPDQRLTFAKENRLCFNCLGAGHRSSECKLNRTCSVKGCGIKRTKYLHLGSTEAKLSNHEDAAHEPSVRSGFISGALSVSAVNGAGNLRVALSVVAVQGKSKGDSQSVSTFALLDTGSTSSFCSESLLRQLGEVGSKQKLHLSTIHCKESVARTSVVNLEVTSADNDYVIDIPLVYSIREIPIREENIVSMEDLEQWVHFGGLDVPQVYSGQVELLIGQDIPEALVPLEIRKGRVGDPFAIRIRTQLDWAVSGPLGGTGGDPVSHFVCSDAELDMRLNKVWKLESCENLSHENGLSPNDRKSLAINHTDGHYELGVPFKCQPVKLTNSRDNC